MAVCTQAARALTARGADVRGLVEREPALGRLLLVRVVLTVAGRADASQSELASSIQDEMSHAT